MDIKVGMHKGIPFEKYNAWPLVRNSDLVHFNRTPAHAREHMTNPPKRTAAMAFGEAYHTAILEPGRFEREYVVAPKVDKRTNVGKEIMADFMAENDGSTILEHDEMVTLRGMQRRLLGHPVGIDLLTGTNGTSEVSIAWVDPATGLTCKARIDRITTYNGQAVLLDLKTTEKDASEKGFMSTMARYYYHQQAGMYSAGMEVLYPGPHRKFIFVVQEKTPPYEPGFYELDPISLGVGKDQFQRNIKTLKSCVEKDNWPGYGDSGIGFVGIPQWAMDQDTLVG